MANEIRVTGLVERPMELGYEGLAALPGQIADVSALAPGRAGGAVQLSAVLDAAGARADAAFITLEAEGDFAASVPLAAVAERALILYALGEGPLPEAQGGPVRFLIPDPAACGVAEVDQCANVKWLRSIELSAERGRDVRPTTLRAHAALHEAEERAREQRAREQREQGEGVAMARLPEVNREAVPEELRAAFDELVALSDNSVPIGPGMVAALSPNLALRRRPLSNYVRWELQLPARAQELAVLVTARQMDCGYVWNAHAPMARKAGVADALIDAIRDRRPLPEMDAEESAVVTFVTEALTARRVSDTAFDAAVAQFGLQNTIDLIALMGQYITNAGFLNVFEVPLPETSEPLLPV